jgi:GNAT superfamily N-acetyltransferase
VDERDGLSRYGYRQELSRQLRLWDLLAYGLVYMVPIAPMAIFGSVYAGSGGMVALAYAIGVVALVFTAFSYAQMVRVWFHRYRPIPPPASYERRLAAACGADVDRFLSLDKIFDIHRPTENHYHLAFLAVAPEMRHTGRANALLNHHHQRLDSLEQPAYAEAASIEGRDLLAWHGYRPLQPFTLPDNGGRIYPMWRPVADFALASHADEPVRPAD